MIMSNSHTIIKYPSLMAINKYYMLVLVTILRIVLQQDHRMGATKQEHRIRGVRFKPMGMVVL